MSKALKEAFSLAHEKVARSKDPMEIVGLIDGIKLMFFAMSSKLSTSDFLELHDLFNWLQTESFKSLGI
jgi:hypothetical protein